MQSNEQRLDKHSPAVTIGIRTSTINRRGMEMVTPLSSVSGVGVVVVVVVAVVVAASKVVVSSNVVVVVVVVVVTVVRAASVVVVGT